MDEELPEDIPDFKFAKIRLQPTTKSKNGWYIWINDVCLITGGPIAVNYDERIPRVTVTLVTDNLTVDE